MYKLGDISDGIYEGAPEVLKKLLDSTRDGLSGPAVHVGVSSAAQKAAASAANMGGKVYFKALKHGPRLLQCLLVLKEDFLARDRTLTRVELDTKGSNW